MESQQFGYPCKMKGSNEPELVPQEEIYIKVLKVTFLDNALKKKVQNGYCMLTTHRILWFHELHGIEVPLFYVKDFAKGGGFFGNPNIKITLHNQDQHPPYVVDLYKNILKRSDLPPKPQLRKEVTLKFKEGNRDKFLEMIKEAVQQRRWTEPIKTQSQQQQQEQQVKPLGGGISGIKKAMESQQKYNQDQISNAFSDLNSLKEKARGLVGIAQQIQNKVAKKEISTDNEDFKEIQQVMFNMGLIQDFSSQVTKDLAGKNYFVELAREVEKFLVNVLEKFGGMLALVDIYCMYNRARGTDLISPEDLLIACEKLTQMSDKVILKSYQSGVKVVQSKHFNEDTYFMKLASIIKETPGLTADRLSNNLKVNVVLMKEQLRTAEEKGYLCRDESYEGIRYYENLFYYESARYFSNQKDLLINQLKAEVFELKSKGQDYSNLREKVMEIELAYRRLLEDKARFEDGLKIRIDHTFSESQHMKSAVDELRYEITIKQKHAAELASEIAQIKQLNQRKEQELYNIDQDLRTKHDTALALQDERENIVYELASVKEEKNKLTSDNHFQSVENRDLSEKLVLIERKLEELSYTLKKQQQTLDQLESEKENKDLDLQRKKDALFSSNAELQRSKDQCEDLRKKEQIMEGSSVDKDLLNKEADRILANELNKLSQQKSDLEMLEREIQQLEQRKRQQIDENEHLKISNRREGEEKEQLRVELIAMEKHVEVLNDQNKALIAELEKFAHADEVIKTTLDRRSQVKELKESMNAEYQRSQYNLRMASPTRR